jgi:hypothetical protein
MSIMNSQFVSAGAPSVAPAISSSALGVAVVDAAVSQDQGILFTTFVTLLFDARQENVAQTCQSADWLASDFDVALFGECDPDPTGQKSEPRDLRKATGALQTAHRADNTAA